MPTTPERASPRQTVAPGFGCAGALLTGAACAWWTGVLADRGTFNGGGYSVLALIAFVVGGLPGGLFGIVIGAAFDVRAGLEKQARSAASGPGVGGAVVSSEEVSPPSAQGTQPDGDEALQR